MYSYLLYIFLKRNLFFLQIFAKDFNSFDKFHVKGKIIDRKNIIYNEMNIKINPLFEIIVNFL